MIPKFILADDFTGAHDVGLPFRECGFDTAVVSNPDHLPKIQADIIVIDTDSRDCSIEISRECVTRACQAIRSLGGSVLYKKIDSTLRGYLGQEIEWVQQIFEYRSTLLAPAFPTLHRTTVGGYHLLDGMPVHRTSAGSDPGSPVHISYIPDLLRSQSALSVTHIDIATLESGRDSILKVFQQNSSGIVVVDAISESDLVLILDAIDSVQQHVLLCGSAGLARILARRLAKQEEDLSAPEISLHVDPGAVLTIAGSINPKTADQVEEVAGHDRITVLRLDAAALLAENGNDEVDRVVLQAGQDLAAGRDMLIALSANEDIKRRIIDASTNRSNIVEELSESLGKIGIRLMETGKPTGLVLTGGETAAQTARHLGAHGTRLVGRVLEGVASATLMGGEYDGLPLVLKPGGFGGVDGLLSCIQHLHAAGRAASSTGERPIMGITIGDPNGVGPEVIVKALSSRGIYEICRPLVIGDAEVMARHRSFATIPMEIHRVTSPHEGVYTCGTIDVLTVDDVDVDALQPGVVQAQAGRLAVESVITATKLALAEDIQAVVTAPLNKEAMNLAGYHYAGHTELLAELTGTETYRLTLAFDEMLVSHVTTHVSLKEAIERLSEDGVISTIEIIGNALKRMGITEPVIAVAGLNPHAGEGGMFGDEEIRIITPAVEKARQAGWQVLGPLPPDTVFLRAQRGDFNGIVGMYHDQGHIPVKAIAFDRSINVSLGLPIIRTSVDHGTAFDIAGKGIANAENMEAAIRMAVRLVGNRWSVEKA